MAKIFTKLLLGDAVYSAGGKMFRKLSAEPQTLAAGLYDANDNLVASWDTLVNTYGMDVSTDYAQNTYKTKTTTPYYVLTNNTALASGVKLIIENVTKIGKYAFGECPFLTSVILPDTVTTIESYSFYKCTALENINIPDIVTRIGGSAFLNCSSLKSINVPNSVTILYQGTFQNCSSIESITLPFVGQDGTTKPFLGFIFGASYWSDNSEYVPSSLKTVTITGGTSIPNNAFRGCEYLTSVILPDSATSIGTYVFYYCSALTSITIGNGVTSIGDYALQWCEKLTSINFNGTVAQWNVVTKGSGWNSGVPATKVTCTDGEVAL